MPEIIRVIEIGGKGIRKADVINGEIKSVFIPYEPITTVRDLLYFATFDLCTDTMAIAYSSAGVINSHRWVVTSPNAHFLDKADLATITEKTTGRIPTVVLNDMEASVTGMHVLFPQLKYFIGITWSSGIGLRVYADGVGIISDSEGGHMCVDASPFARLCGCGRRGCIEAIAGGINVTCQILTELQARGLEAPPPGMHPCKYLDEAYLANNDWAMDLYHQITTGMGVFLANLVTLLRPTAIVWKGSFAQSALRISPIEEAIRATMYTHLMQQSWADELKFLFVPSPPELIEDGEAYLGAAEFAKLFLKQL
ncbi:MAG: ROK family protein [bacterium]